MNTYQIIDEPKVKKSNQLIVNPVLILFASILIPLFWMPPFFGRWWMPFVWIVFNGYLLGSSSFKKELFISILGVFLIFVILQIFTVISQYEPFNQMQSFAQYALITINAVFFLMLYFVVFKQSISYDIYIYMKGK